MRSMYEDREGGLWVGTVTSGAIRFRDGSATTFGRLQGVHKDVVRALMQDRSGRFLRRPRERRPGRPHRRRHVRHRSGARAPAGGQHPGVVRRRRAGRPDRLERRTVSISRRRADRCSRPVLFSLAGYSKPVAGSSGPSLDRHQSRPCPPRRQPDARLVRAASADTGSFITSLYQDQQGTVWVGAIAGGLSRVGGDTLLPYAWPGVADPPRDVRVITPGPAGRCGSAPSPPCGGSAATRRSPSIGPTDSRATRRSPFWMTAAARCG